MEYFAKTTCFRQKIITVLIDFDADLFSLIQWYVECPPHLIMNYCILASNIVYKRHLVYPRNVRMDQISYLAELCQAIMLRFFWSTRINPKK